MPETPGSTHSLLQCVVVTPERELLDQQADSVILPMYDGELGVYPGRTPLIGRLGAGELRIRHGASTERFYVDGGFAQVRANVVTVLTQKAARPQEINVAAVEQFLATPPPLTYSEEETDAALSDRQRARAQLRVATGGAR